ncbi:hypothetical protein CSCA_4533 [Clostridium scatologenes]|uniref:Uncharacterized protein n=1 Tax=Clostridium scatologenes TaxID=1548 RepID=A0A0E3K3I5_CLOSL|nr:hypothetical protein CSCA_4533 [Clostridium scatologenes]
MLKNCPNPYSIFLIYSNYSLEHITNACFSEIKIKCPD